ncbi:MAG: GTP 3',8-cyclase MoaA [Mycobacteriales bacterium]
MGELSVTLVDGFGRVHRDLRVSLTDRCNLRCSYCMPAEGVPWLPRAEMLTSDELVRLVTLLVRLGVTEIRLTGGEPTLRPDVVDLVRRFAALGPEVSMTTNGMRLTELAGPLVQAGLARVNVSLDTLRPDRFRELTRRSGLDRTLAGLRAARDAGLRPVRINTVLLRGVNDDEAVDLLAFALAEGYELRFIEQMPLDAGHVWRREAMVTADEILARLRAVYRLEPFGVRGSEPAERWTVDGGPGTVGVIASVTRPFCAACDRLRLTADGQLRNCLFARDESDLRGPLRAGASEAELEARIRATIGAKRAGHGVDSPEFLQPRRPMSAIGG